MYALLGEKLGHSISPLIHGLIFRELEIQKKYKLLEVAACELEHLICSRKYEGFNVTIPYKVDVIPYLDDLSTEARQIGAVNTIEYSKQGIIGHNTDYWGFAKMLEDNNILVTGTRVAVLGMGASAKTVASYLTNKQAKEVYVVSRTPVGQASLPGTQLIGYQDLAELNNMDIIVNTTPMGMYPNVRQSPVTEEVLAKFSIAVDLIYNPIQTVFLQYAKRQQVQRINGLHMLVGQAVYAQEIWQKCKISRDIIDKIYKEISSGYEK